MTESIQLHLGMDRTQAKARTIEGLPPNLTNYPKGCPFAPRCQFAIAWCHDEDPALEAVGDRHQVACWVKPVGAEVLQDRATA